VIRVATTSGTPPASFGLHARDQPAPSDHQPHGGRWTTLKRSFGPTADRMTPPGDTRAPRAATSMTADVREFLTGRGRATLSQATGPASATPTTGESAGAVLSDVVVPRDVMMI